MKEAQQGSYNPKTKVYEITFEEFVKLYINHRPAFGISTEDIKNAFSELNPPLAEISKNNFINLMCQKGK